MSDHLVGYLFTAALLWALLATTYRLAQWALTPSPLPIVLTPAPVTRGGVALRLMLELFAFKALYRASKITWLASLAFHYGFLLVLIVHLRFVLPQLPLVLVAFIRFSGWATLIMCTGLLVLLLRRLVVDRVRYISTPSDYLHLLLLLSIAASGAAMKRFWPVDLYGVGQFLQGSLSFSWRPLPEGFTLTVHVVLVILLFLVFPISKLLHGIGILFSPTLNERGTSEPKKPAPLSASSPSLPSAPSPPSAGPS